MKKEKESKSENDQRSLDLEGFLQKKKDENEALKKLLKALQNGEEKGLGNK